MEPVALAFVSSLKARQPAEIDSVARAYSRSCGGGCAIVWTAPYVSSNMVSVLWRTFDAVREQSVDEVPVFPGRRQPPTVQSERSAQQWSDIEANTQRFQFLYERHDFCKRHRHSPTKPIQTETHFSFNRRTAYSHG
jgi:hypothetical protein